MRLFSVPTMSCGHCKATVEKALDELSAITFFEVDLDSKTVNIDGGVDDETVISAIVRSGHEAVRN